MGVTRVAQRKIKWNKISNFLVPLLSCADYVVGLKELKLLFFILLVNACTHVKSVCVCAYVCNRKGGTKKMTRATCRAASEAPLLQLRHLLDKLSLGAEPLHWEGRTLGVFAHLANYVWFYFKIGPGYTENI